MTTILPETATADEGFAWAYLYLESERGPWLEVGRTVGRNIALNGARSIASALAAMKPTELKDRGWVVTLAISKCMAEGKDLSDLKLAVRTTRDNTIAFARGMASGLGNPNRRAT
jgi:hypothetical protein